MNVLAFRDWETRDEGDGDDANAVAEIRQAVEGFTQSAETRLTGIDAALTEIRARLDRTETTLRRPGGGGGNGDQGQRPAIEARAFTGYLRQGRELMQPDEVRSLRVSDDVAGGYLAPDQFIAELQRNVVQFSPVRSIARVSPISASAAIQPKRLSGMTAQWVGETSPRPETTVTVGQNRFEVREIACWVDVSNQMLEDSAFDVAAELSFEFAEEFGRAEGAAFVNGTGVLQPSGFMQSADVPYTATGSADNITIDSLIALYLSVPPAYRANGTWVLNSASLSRVLTLQEEVGARLVFFPGGLAGAPGTTILGRPVIEMPDMPDVAANDYPVVFGDFRQAYRIFDRVSLSVLRDPYSQATNGMTRFHGRRRVAAGVAKPEAIRKMKISLT